MDSSIASTALNFPTVYPTPNSVNNIQPVHDFSQHAKSSSDAQDMQNPAVLGQMLHFLQANCHALQCQLYHALVENTALKARNQELEARVAAQPTRPSQPTIVVSTGKPGQMGRPWKGQHKPLDQAAIRPVTVSAASMSAPAAGTVGVSTPHAIVATATVSALARAVVNVPPAAKRKSPSTPQTQVQQGVDKVKRVDSKVKSPESDESARLIFNQIEALKDRLCHEKPVMAHKVSLKMCIASVNAMAKAATEKDKVKARLTVIEDVTEAIIKNQARKKLSGDSRSAHWRALGRLKMWLQMVADTEESRRAIIRQYVEERPEYWKELTGPKVLS
jgi:hypothetical protein